MLHRWLSVHVSPQSYPHPFVTSTLTIFKVASCLVLLSVIVPLPFESYICWENKAMRKERPRHTHTLKSPSLNSPSMFLFWPVPSLDHFSKAQDSLLLDTVSKAPPGGVHQPLLLLGEPPIPSFLWISPTLPSWFLHLHPGWLTSVGVVQPGSRSLYQMAPWALLWLYHGSRLVVWTENQPQP